MTHLKVHNGDAGDSLKDVSLGLGSFKSAVLCGGGVKRKKERSNTFIIEVTYLTFLMM